MTDQELKDLVAGLAVKSKETDRQIEETDRQIKETAREIQETAREIKELKESLKELGVQVGGINENIGHHAEQFFQSVFKEKLEFGGIKYDKMAANLVHGDKTKKIEFDIALINGNSIALIEVKNRIHPNFVQELAEERVEKFRKYFSEYSDYDVYLGIAGFSFNDEVLDQASKYGVGIVRQVGEGVEVEANNLKAY